MTTTSQTLIERRRTDSDAARDSKERITGTVHPLTATAGRAPLNVHAINHIFVGCNIVTMQRLIGTVLRG